MGERERERERESKRGRERERERERDVERERCGEIDIPDVKKIDLLSHCAPLS